MILNMSLFSKKEISVDNLKQAAEKLGFEVIEIAAGFKQLEAKA